MSLKSEQYSKEASGTMTVTPGALSLKAEDDSCDNFPSVHVDEEDYDSSESAAGTPEPDAASPRKRKDQDELTLPLAPGALPPRKRAKTKDEKEQRRIERIMRNRQAAHASREKKRRHVEELETKCVELTTTTEDLSEQLKQSQRAQVQAEEQHLLLQARLEQLEAAVQLARTSGDVSILENALATAPVLPQRSTSLSLSDDSAIAPLTVSPSSTTHSSPKVDAEAALDQLLEPWDLPQLTHSASNSPQSNDEFDADNELSFLFDSFETPLALTDSFSKTHHPAVMMY